MDLRLGIVRELVRELVVDGQQETHTLLFGLRKSGPGDIQLVELDERLADVLSLRLQKGVGHAAADDNGVDLFEQVVDDLDLIGDLGATDDGDEGLVRPAPALCCPCR